MIALRRTVPLRRIPSLLGALPPPPPLTCSRPRLFTQNCQLLLISHSTPRPQLPFLSPSSHAGPSSIIRTRLGQWQLSRLLTTERKQYIRQQLWLGGKLVAITWTSTLCLVLSALYYHTRTVESKHPSPSEWSSVTRLNYRSARWNEDAGSQEMALVNWANAGDSWKVVIERLEDPNKDGQGIRELDDGGLYVADVGKVGLDVDEKSSAWRSGYFEALMGAARAAEHLDGWLNDRTRNIAFPPEVVIGPSNPNPRPCPPGAAAAPSEEDCIPAFEPPQKYYMKILTTRGFTTKERLTAALAYADWLDYKGLSESAGEMYRWGLDIAASPYLDPTKVVDTTTGVIPDRAARVSPNVLLASTSFAIHQARTSNVSAALSTFLSVLRARRALEEPSVTDSRTDSTTRPSGSPSLLNHARKLVTDSYPMALDNSDVPALRSPKSICEEAGLMAYVGEILFALASHNDGLGWTRDAVDAAESQLRAATNDEDAQQRCTECLDVALTNWHKMVEQLAENDVTGEERPGAWSFWGSMKKADPEKWKKELVFVEERTRKIKTELVERGMKKSASGSGGMLFG
ncbi:MAG: hypothetical protein M1817_003849 [Caeruleum heppii]|nr:MAG: hypothetical protein M1817_003849 [Caeruleum heppii]